MDIAVFIHDDLPTVLRVLRTALHRDGALDAREQQFLATYARIVHLPAPAADPEPIDAADVRIAGRHARKRLVQLAALAVLLGRPVKAASFDFLRALALELDAHDPVIELIDALRRGRLFEVRLRAMRRGMRAMLKEAWLGEGAAGVARFVVAMASTALGLKPAVNKGRMGAYKRLGLLPDGTLGREYWKFMVREGFNFPGEPAGIPLSVSYHDVAHVLAGHAATPLGEIQQGGFQGGNRREDGFFFIQFVVLHFHHGVPITPGTPPCLDLFDPEKLLWAIHRGAQCTVDMTHQWDYWPLMALPLAEARRRCALLPKLSQPA